jgi:hypothetical protein
VNQTPVLPGDLGPQKVLDGALDAEDLAVCTAMGIKPEEFKKTKQLQEVK